jgi:hypothetical protein
LVTVDLKRMCLGLRWTKRAISGCDRPMLVSPTKPEARVLPTPVQSNCGSLTTMVATSALERPRPARKARTVSGLAGDLRWENFV